MRQTESYVLEAPRSMWPVIADCSVFQAMLEPYLIIPPQTLFVMGKLFLSCPSVTFFFNILKSHSFIFIRPCKHVHICKTNTLDKKVRARGQFF